MTERRAAHARVKAGVHNNTMNPTATSLRSAAAGYRARWAVNRRETHRQGGDL